MEPARSGGVTSPVPDQRVIPTLRITDEARSRAFYVDQLGFRVDWEHRFEPHLPVLLQVSRDGMTLYLSQHAMDCAVGGLVHLFVDRVDDWHAELGGKGVAVELPPTDQPWGLREMHVVDPDGNRLRICTRRPGRPRARDAGYP
jgi:catechol 2,3-dioxygenase-like lactoylglutathione lyase family enzyme